MAVYDDVLVNVALYVVFDLLPNGVVNDGRMFLSRFGNLRLYEVVDAGSKVCGRAIAVGSSTRPKPPTRPNQHMKHVLFGSFTLGRCGLIIGVAHDVSQHTTRGTLIIPP